MMSSCCTLRLKRRNALSIDSPSWTFTSAKLETPPNRVDSKRETTKKRRTTDYERELCELIVPGSSLLVEFMDQPNAIGYHRVGGRPRRKLFPRNSLEPLDLRE